MHILLQNRLAKMSDFKPFFARKLLKDNNSKLQNQFNLKQEKTIPHSKCIILRGLKTNPEVQLFWSSTPQPKPTATFHPA